MKAALEGKFTYPCGCSVEYKEGDEMEPHCLQHKKNPPTVDEPAWEAADYVLSIRLDSLGRVLVLATDGWAFDRDQTLEMYERIQGLIESALERNAP